jgi:hypothetical protein
MIDTVQDLARVLASASVTVDSLVRRLGPIDADHSADAALDLRSADARFSRVQLWRDADTGLPSMLALDLAPAVRPAIYRACLAPTSRAFPRPRALPPT